MSFPVEQPRLRDPNKRPVETPLPAPRPRRQAHEGRYARLEPLDPARHGPELYPLGHADEAGLRTWDYLPYGPFASEAEHRAWLEARAAGDDPLFSTVVDRASGKAVGLGTLMSIVPEQGRIEIGHLWFSPALQRTPAATEAIFLMLRHAMDDLGYRRMEWKCDAANLPSRRAAKRFGYQYEGIFYNHLVVKGENRDTAWYSILDEEWPRLRRQFEAWLDPANFDEQGRQRVSLADLTRPE